MAFGRSGGSVGALAPVQPFEFATYRSPGAIAKRTIVLLATAQSARGFAVPIGKFSGMRPGKVLHFVAGGIMSTGTIQGTLMISPSYGAGTTAGTTGISLGPSPEQAFATGLVKTPWRLVAEILFLSVSLVANSSSILCTGQFVSGGDPSVDGSGLTIPFGSGNPVTVDSKGPISATSGAFNISATFAARLLAPSVSISTQYAFVRSL